MPAALDINREAVRTLVVAVGVREAARQMGLAESTVQAWSARGKWTEKINQAQSIARSNLQPTATKPAADALTEALIDDSKATRIGFSKAARKVAAKLSESDAESLTTPAMAITASKWQGVAASTHGWNEKQESGNVMVNIGILGVDPKSIEVNETRTLQAE